MAEPSPLSRVLVVADRVQLDALVDALAGVEGIALLTSSGGDETLELAARHRPLVAVVAATLELGDTGALIGALRAQQPRGEIAVVLLGDEVGTVRTSVDALELAPDRFVPRPAPREVLAAAVSETVARVRVARIPPTPPIASGTLPGFGELAREPASAPPAAPRTITSDAASSGPSRAALRARWAALADALHAPEVPEVEAPQGEGPVGEAQPVTGAPAAEAPRSDGDERANERPSAVRAARPSPPEPPPIPAPPPAPVVIQPRNRLAEPAREDEGRERGPRFEAPAAATREPTLILREGPPSPPPQAARPPGAQAMAPAQVPAVPSSAPTLILPRSARAAESAPAAAAPAEPAPSVSRAPTPELGADVVVAARTSSDELWSEPVALAAVADRERGDDVARGDLARTPAPVPATKAEGDGASLVANKAGDQASEPRDFARELRAKMSQMAQRLFHGGSTPPPSDLALRHDHRTEIDLAALGDDPPLGGAGSELDDAPEPRRPELRDGREPRESHDVRDALTPTGTWDTQVRERGLPDAGTIVRGVSDAAMLLARMFALGATGRLRFRRDDVETVVHCDHGRPVFASSNEPRDRMGELLLREGKITAAQYARCQTVVAESGRRMGEILVEFGYLKRRELLPAVRRHVEDLVYSLFGWQRGSYSVALDTQPCAERIRLSRHPAALILEGIRRKFDRGSLERLVGPTSTVIDVRDRERLGGIVQQGDLTIEERGALAAFDGQAELSQVARAAGVSVGEILPLAWGLCVLGLATARRSDAELPDEAPALVGEADLAIDRERVRARWQLVTEADYFALLGVRRDATGFEIRRAYQAARRDFAADCFPVDLRRELARELDEIAHVLDEAFRVLRDDRLRQRYLANLIDG